MARPTTTTGPSDVAASRWSVVAAFAVVGAATQIVWLNYAGATTVAATRFGVSEGDVGLLSLVFPLLYVVLAIPAGLLLDRWFRASLTAGAVLTAAGAAVRLVDDTFAWALVGQVVVGIALPLVLNAITGVAGRYLAERDRPTGIAVATASTFAGMVIAFLLGAVLPGADGLRAAVAIGAGVAVVGAVAVAVALRRPGRPHRAMVGLDAFRVAARDGLIQRLCLLVFFPFGTFVALTTFGQALLEPGGVGADTASVILLVNVVAGVAGCAILPIVAVRYRAERAVLVAAGAAAGAGCLAMALVPGAGVAFLAMVVIGFVLLPALPLVLDLVERRTGEAEGTGAGLVWMAGNLGGFVIAAAVGSLVDRPMWAFAVMGLASLVAIPLVRLLRGPMAGLTAVPRTE